MLLLIAVVAMAGCGSSGSTDSTASMSATTGHTTTTASAPASNATSTTGAAGGTTTSRAQPAAGTPSAGGPSPRRCVRAWNGPGPAPSLANVVLPAARVAGPFRAEVGHRGERCAIVVHATGIEGGASVTYEMTQGPDGRFVQAAVPALGGGAASATLERDGRLRPGG